MLKNSQTLLIIALLLSIEFTSVSAESQAQVGDLIIEPFNESLIKNNIVILIDSSGSTANNIYGSSINDNIDANAISLIRDLGRCTSVGVVTFGAETTKTDMLSMSNDTNKKQLEMFIRDNGKPKSGATILDEGLLAAEVLLNSVMGTKEIFIISDGFIPPDSISRLKETVVSLKNNNTNIQFLEILEKDMARMPNDNYELLAKAAGTNVMLLYPDERITIPIAHHLGNASNANEPCISPTPTITSSPTITIVPPTPNSQLEQEVKELKERLNKTEEKQSQQETRISWLESAVNSILGWINSFL